MDKLMELDERSVNYMLLYLISQPKMEKIVFLKIFEILEKLTKKQPLLGIFLGDLLDCEIFGFENWV